MPATLTTVDAILKEVYGPRIEDQLQNETTAIKRIERTSDGVVETVGGKYVDFPIRVQRNTGIGYRNESEQLPAAGQQGYAEVHVPLKYGYGRVQLTGQLMQLAETKTQAFASAMDNEMEYLKDDVAKDQNRIVYADASGLMASVTDTAAATGAHTVDNVQYLEVGMLVDVLTKTTGAPTVSNTAITAIDPVTKTVTTAATYTGAVTLGFYRQGDYGREPTGFGGIVAAGLLHTLNSSTQPKWQGVVDVPGADRALSEGLMIEMCDKIRVNGGKVSAIFTNLGVRRAYFNLLSQQRRYNDTKEFAGGFRGLAFNYGTEVPVVEDVDAPPNQMLFMDESKIKIYRNKEWHWMDEDNSILKWVTNFDAYEAVLRHYSEFGTSQRNAHGRMGRVLEG